MVDQTYDKKEIARQQLMTATRLFLFAPDYSSVITLAAAAGSILHTLVVNEGKMPFNEYARQVAGDIFNQIPSREKHAHRINEIFGINVHKHMNGDSPESVSLDLKDCATRTLGRAMIDYVTISGGNEDFVKAYFQWAWDNLNGPKIMEEYKNVPRKFKP